MKDITIIKAENLSETEISQIKKVEINCRLSRWTLADYGFEQKRNDSIFLLAKFDARIIGFLIARIIPIEDTAEADLLNFGVLNSLRNQGVGRKLYEVFLNAASKSKVGTIWLEVRRSNEGALAFYLKRRFEIVQIRKNFYSNPAEDALVLKLRRHPK